MTEATTLIPVGELIPMLTAISDRNWEKFKEVERQFVTQHGIEAWKISLLTVSNQHWTRNLIDGYWFSGVAEDSRSGMWRSKFNNQ
ncbi:hypothetical protein NIES4106_62090 (plasmid) [Fischerella sp. NIES-4106]|nr:hypothetical protein NIES4106_62090 [Fischerella sp. NIES-4106]